MSGVWEELSGPWRAAFEQAWLSYCEGHLGIGAVLVDPTDGQVVATGRNRVNGVVDEARVLSGNFMAHAEMNAFAALDRFKADGLELYTTLQPCLMCAATSVFMHTHTVHFASADEFFEGLGDLWSHHPYSDRNKPIEIGPLEGVAAVFARLLPLRVQAAEQPDGSVIRKARQRIPELAQLATSANVIAALDDVRSRKGSAADALAAITPSVSHMTGESREM